jgi:hypothetical protein
MGVGGSVRFTKDQVVFGLMLAGNALFFAAYIIGMAWKNKP